MFFLWDEKLFSLNKLGGHLSLYNPLINEKFDFSDQENCFECKITQLNFTVRLFQPSTWKSNFDIFFLAKIVISQKKNLNFHKYSGLGFLDYIDLPYHFGILRMSTFQEIIQFFNDTHVRNAIHENVCVIFYGTDLTWLVVTFDRAKAGLGFFE